MSAATDFITAVRAALKKYDADTAVVPPPPPPGGVNGLKAVYTAEGTGKIVATWTPVSRAIVVSRSDPYWEQAVPAGTSTFTFTNFEAGKTYTIKADTAAVSVSTPATPVTPPDSTGTTAAAPMGLPVHPVTLYHMCWSSSGSPPVSSTPANVNMVALAFAQGDPPQMVGTASDGANFGPALRTLRARGVRVGVSVGGGGGFVNPGNIDAFVNAIVAISTGLCPLDFLDWDIEGAAMNPANIVAICQKLRAARGQKFGITMAPNGANIDDYLNCAVALKNAGLVDANFTLGQQFYDSVVSKEAAKGRVDGYVARGLPVNRYLVGMMVGDADTYWTVQECIDAFTYIKAAYPTIGGAYLWEAGRAGTADWANRVGALTR